MMFLQCGIAGSATAVGFEGQIVCESLNFGVGRAISMEPGNCSNRETTRASLSELTFSTKVDTSAVALFSEAVKGAAGRKAVFTLCKVAADKLIPYMTYTLENALVSSYSVSATGDHADSQVSFSYTKMEVKYTERDAKNKAGGQQISSYDLATSQAG